MLDPRRAEFLPPAAVIDALGLRGDERVADVGAGPGFLTLELARRVPRGEVLATDIDAAALSVLALRARQAGLRNVRTEPVRPTDPGMAEGSIDVALLCQVDQYLPDRARYFGALRPTLSPHGRVVLVNMHAYRDADVAAARAAGFRSLRELPAPPGFFILTCEK